MVTELIAHQQKVEQDGQRSTVEARYPYGWREQVKIMADGRSVVERIPLTLADVLHPQEDDFLMTSDEHAQFCNYLYNALRWAVRADPSAHVLNDTNVEWGFSAEGCPRPDLAVLFGVGEHKNWSTFVVAEEGIAPTLIIEITSPKTRRVDLDDKVDEYEQVGVPYYIIVDKHVRKRRTTRQLLGWELTQDGYVAMPLDEQDRLWLPPVKLWLCIEDEQLICYDEEGRPVVDYVMVATARAQAEVRAAEEAKRATEEARRAAEEAKRAAEEAARAAKEASRAEAAEARIRQLEEELRRRAQ